MSKRRLVIFGSQEMAQLARFYFTQDSPYDVVAFTVDDAYAKQEAVDGLPLVPFSHVSVRFPPSQHEMFIALSYRQLNRLREAKYQQARAAGYRLASYICTRAVRWPDLVHGDNCFVLENQTLQPGVVLGDGVTLWSGNHIGHGTQIGDHTYVASHVVVSGHCRVGRRCFLGVNATLKDFTALGDDCFVAMDASVTRDLKDGSVAVGTEVYDNDDRRARALKRSYFGI
jgi:sugar O-acyltransferase (sialic acid O-acetyltransferase NeuD family)